MEHSTLREMESTPIRMGAMDRIDTSEGLEGMPGRWLGSRQASAAVDSLMSHLDEYHEINVRLSRRDCYHCCRFEASCLIIQC